MKHLNNERWAYRTPTGQWRMKRVPKALDEQFPRDLRKILYSKGPVACVKEIMRREEQLTLAAAWAKLKAMCNA